MGSYREKTDGGGRRKEEEDALQRASGGPTTPLPGVLPALTFLQRESKNALPRLSHQVPSTDPTSGITTAPGSTNHPTPQGRGFGKRGRGTGRGRGETETTNCARGFAKVYTRRYICASCLGGRCYFSTWSTVVVLFLASSRCLWDVFIFSSLVSYARNHHLAYIVSSWSAVVAGCCSTGSTSALLGSSFPSTATMLWHHVKDKPQAHEIQYLQHQHRVYTYQRSRSIWFSTGRILDVMVRACEQEKYYITCRRV